MTGKNIIYALMASFVLGLSSCANEEMGDSFDRTADGSIDLTVGVESSPYRMTLTRAGETQSSYYAMMANTQVRLKVDGKWTGKDPEAISQKTTCTAQASATSINTLSFTDSEMLYWDDYGTGDPANSANTANGVNVLGVAVDGMANAPTIATDAEWESLSWPVITNGENVLNGDIIVSNNLTAYTFADRNNDLAKKMIFVHPLSKITINLKAGAGFTKGTVGATANKFEKDPTLWLSNSTTLAGVDTHSNDYALTTGTVSIRNANATSDGNTAKLVAGTTSTTDADITVIKQAIVYPGTQLGDGDDAVIAVLNADDNIYYIKAKEIHAAITATGGHTDFKTLAGRNYIINITVNKTGLVLTATVTNWVDVNSDEVHPVINVDATVGSNGDNPSTENVFAFYRSENIEKDYVKAASPTAKTDGTIDWTNTTTLYWTSHYQHYHFRGIYPETTTVTTDAYDRQCVAVTNGDYDATTFPGNFVMGMPEIASGTMCGNPDHTQVDMSTDGICAREAPINLNFRYMMSQVEVVLSTSAPGAYDHVDLSNVEVQLVNVYNSGNILLKDRSAVVTGDAGDYKLTEVNLTDHKYLGVIVPQALTYTTAGASTNVRIKITVTNSDSTKDIYYADVNPILKKGTANLIAPNGKWESGTHYVYNLKVTKTEIKVTASLTDWNVVEATEDVWF